MEQKITVKKIIECWDKTGIEGLKILLNEVKIFDNTWAHKIKTLIEKNHIESVNKEIELVSFNIDLKNKIYKPKKDNGNGNTKNS